VRFRLGGSCFPPLVFYKIFTHRPVTDVGMFCPRNYSAEALLPQSIIFDRLPNMTPCSSSAATVIPSTPEPPKFEADFSIPEAFRRFVRPDGTIGFRDTTGWYQRRENNGWRPVNEVKMLDGEDVLGTGRRYRPTFHFKRSVRLEDQRRRQKLRRREWMVALYKCDPLCDRSANASKKQSCALMDTCAFLSTTSAVRLSGTTVPPGCRCPHVIT
jgi:hypothetical protein